MHEENKKIFYEQTTKVGCEVKLQILKNFKRMRNRA